MISVRPDPIPGNFTPGRERPILGVVVHIMDGTMQGTRSWFRSPISRVSAHYGISRAGEIVQYVDDADTAWHAGQKIRPTAPLVLEEDGNPNDYLLGFEFEGYATQDPTEAQLAAGAELLAVKAREHRFPLDRRRVIMHREIRADKSCPGRIDPTDLLIRARGGPSVVEELPAAPAVNVERITVPTPAHVREIIRLRALPRDRWGPGLEVAEVFLRGLQAGGVRWAKPIADALSAVLNDEDR